MKKLVLLLLIAALFAVACGGEEQTTPEPSEPEGGESASAEDLPNPDVGAEDEEILIEPQSAEPFEMPVLPQSVADKVPEYDETQGYIPEGEAEAGEPMAYAIAESFIEAGNDEQLVGLASNVLVGEVVEEYDDVALFTEPAPDTGETEPAMAFRKFVVEVGAEVKGSIPEGQVHEEADDGAVRILVAQAGGQLAGGLPVEITNGDPLLKPGSKYLLVLNWDDELGAFVIILQPEGDIEVQSAEHEENLIHRFEVALEGEVSPQEVFDEINAAAEEVPAEEVPQPNVDDPPGEEQQFEEGQ